MSSTWREAQRGREVGLAVGLLFVATTVGAQSGRAQSGGAGGARSGGKKADAEITFRKGSTLSVAEQLAQGQRYLDNIDQHQAKVKKLLVQARKDKDIIRLNCVNDKLTRIKGSRTVARQAYVGLKSQADTGMRNHGFAKLTIAFQKVLVLAQEAEACVGEDLGFVGDTEVETEVDPDIVQQGDPTVEPQPAVPVIRPPVASPTT